MRLFFLMSMLVVECGLAGCAGELPETAVDSAKAIQSVVGTAAKPAVDPQQEGSASTASYTISVSITIDPGLLPDGGTDAQGTAAQ